MYETGDTVLKKLYYHLQELFQRANWVMSLHNGSYVMDYYKALFGLNGYLVSI